MLTILYPKYFGSLRNLVIIFFDTSSIDSDQI